MFELAPDHIGALQDIGLSYVQLGRYDEAIASFWVMFIKVVENARLRDERNQVLRLFGQHTAPAIVDELLRAGADTASRRLHVCIMFADVRGFTAFSEQRDPEAVVAYLNALFDVMIDLVNRHHGIIHQLLGDGLMAIFGAPLSP